MEADTTTTVQDNAAEQAESAVQGGEVDQTTSTETGGESDKQASDGKKTQGTEGLFDGMDGPSLHKSYKSLQSEYTKVQSAIKKLERFGGPDQIAQWAEYLQNNPRFAEWVQKEQRTKVTGIDDSEMDETTRKAYETVQKIADSTADNKIRQILQNEIAPMEEILRKQLIDGHFKDMDSKYGEDWRELQDKMSELSEDLPNKIKIKPKFKDVEALFYRALSETGKFDAYAAKMHNKKLQTMKKQSSDKPGSAIPSAPKKYKTITEAFEAAKRAQSAS